MVKNFIKIAIIAIIIFCTIWFITLHNQKLSPVNENQNHTNTTPTPIPTLEPTLPPTTPPTPTSTPSPIPIPTPPDIPKIPTGSTIPTKIATVRVGLNTYTFNPANVQTTRPDIFKPGFFSAFDILVQLHKQGDLELQYHFDQSKNTHIIDSINQQTDWWYQIYYSGGWLENNVFRPDHYPWKDQTTLTFYQESREKITRIYTIWEQEVDRKTANQAVIIPEVQIISRSFQKTFDTVVVTPHNLRNDIFQEGTITALDVILSLADQGRITYQLEYYETIGSAEIVKNYWVESIDQDIASGRCGYVYEAGSRQYQGFIGNHIHLPSDIRVLNSPEYVEYFWICI